MPIRDILTRTAFFGLLCLTLLFPACDIPKGFFFDYDECFDPTDVGQKVGTFWRFTQPVFINPGTLTLRGKVNAVNSNQEIPRIFLFDFRYTRAKQTLVHFQEDVNLTSTGKIPLIKVNFPDPGIDFHKNDRLYLDIYPIDRNLPLTNWDFKVRYRPNPPSAVILAPFQGAPFTITLEAADEE